MQDEVDVLKVGSSAYGANPQRQPLQQQAASLNVNCPLGQEDVVLSSVEMGQASSFPSLSTTAPDGLVVPGSQDLATINSGS